MPTPTTTTEKKAPAKSTTKGSTRPCGCALVGSHRKTCKLAPTPVPQTCGCGREFGSMEGLNGHRRTCKGAAKAKKAAPTPPTSPPPVDEPSADLVNHPPHYTSHPSGIECIQVTEHMSFNLGNAIKYLWRADEKGSPITDLEKARWYVEREIARRKAAVSALPAPTS